MNRQREVTPEEAWAAMCNDDDDVTELAMRQAVQDALREHKRRGE